MTDYHTPEGVSAWIERCGFETVVDAAAALRCTERTMYYFKARGLPVMWSSYLIEDKMREIEWVRTGRRGPDDQGFESS